LGIIHRFTGDLVAAESAYLKSMEYWRFDGSYYH